MIAPSTTEYLPNGEPYTIKSPLVDFLDFRHAAKLINKYLCILGLALVVELGDHDLPS